MTSDLPQHVGVNFQACVHLCVHLCVCVCVRMCVCLWGGKEKRGELTGERLVSAVCSAWGPK